MPPPGSSFLRPFLALIRMESTKENSYECPVCFDKLINTIFQCYNGHLICNQCVAKVERCPVCRDSMPRKRIRNLEVEKLAAETNKPRQLFLCSNKNIGCLNNQKHSLMDCDFVSDNFCNRLQIPQKCNAILSKSNLLQHLQDKHLLTGSSVNAGETMEIQQSVELLHKSSATLNPIYMCFGLRNVFFLRTRFQATGEVCWGVDFLGSPETAEGYSARIKLFLDSKSKDLQQSAVKFLKWGGPVQSLFSGQQPREYFRVPVETMKALLTEQCNGNRLWQWKLQIRVVKHKNMNKSTVISARIQSHQVCLPDPPPPFQPGKTSTGNLIFGPQAGPGPNVFTVVIQNSPGIICAACGACPNQSARYYCNVCGANLCPSCRLQQHNLVNFHNSSKCKN